MPRVKRLGQAGLRRLERQTLARAVTEGVAETVALSRARGQAIEPPDPKAGRRQPYRRQTGLDWLAAKGRIDVAARAAGERYGQVWRRAATEPRVPSSLEIAPGGGTGRTRSLAQMVAHGEGTEHARRRLETFRARLGHQRDLVAACDLVCGQEMTPREAARVERDAARIEAVLKVALDLLVGAEG